MPKILFVDDDVEQLQTIKSWFARSGHELDSAETITRAQDYLATVEYDLIILDWNLPDGTGLEVLSKLRSDGRRVPVLMLTGNAGIDYKESGFSAGADDYLTKPFDMRELSLRIDALLRRPATYTGVLLSAADIELDMRTFSVRKSGKPLKLQPKELALLVFFMRNPGIVFSAEAIMERVWSTDAELGPESVRKCVQRLREKIDAPDAASSLIKTNHTHGYSFQP